MTHLPQQQAKPSDNEFSYSTLEAIQHHPELASRNATPNNGLHGPETLSTATTSPKINGDDGKFSTLEPSPNINGSDGKFSTLELSPQTDTGAFSTLEPYNNPDRAYASEKIVVLGSSEAEAPAPSKENWKRRRVCGIPLLFLLIGLVVLIAVVAAVVGGIVGSRSKSITAEPAEQLDANGDNKSSVVTPQTSTSTETGSSTANPTTTASTTTSTSTASSASPTNRIQDTWITGVYTDTHTIKVSYDTFYYVTGWYKSNDTAVGLTEIGDTAGDYTSDEQKWQFVNVSLEVQDSWKDSSNWGDEGPTTLYTLSCRKNHEKVLGIDLDSADAVARGYDAKTIALSMDNDTDTRQSAWYFRALNDSSALKGDEIPWAIHNINLDSKWAMGIPESGVASFGAYMVLGDGREWRNSSLTWTLPKPI